MPPQGPPQLPKAPPQGPQGLGRQARGLRAPQEQQAAARLGRGRLAWAAAAGGRGEAGSSSSLPPPGGS